MTSLRVILCDIHMWKATNKSVDDDDEAANEYSKVNHSDEALQCTRRAILCDKLMTDRMIKGHHI